MGRLQKRMRSHPQRSCSSQWRSRHPVRPPHGWCPWTNNRSPCRRSLWCGFQPRHCHRSAHRRRRAAWSAAGGRREAAAVRQRSDRAHGPLPRPAAGQACGSSSWHSTALRSSSRTGCPCRETGSSSLSPPAPGRLQSQREAEGLQRPACSRSVKASRWHVEDGRCGAWTGKGIKAGEELRPCTLSQGHHPFHRFGAAAEPSVPTVDREPSEKKT